MGNLGNKSQGTVKCTTDFQKYWVSSVGASQSPLPTEQKKVTTATDPHFTIRIQSNSCGFSSQLLIALVSAAIYEKAELVSHPGHTKSE